MANGDLLQGLSQGFQAFALNQPLGDIQQRDIDRQRLAQSRELQQQVAQEGLGSQAFSQLAGIDAQSATKLKGLLKTDDQGLDAVFKDAAVFSSLQQADPTGQRGSQFLQSRIGLGESQGRDMFLTKGLLETNLKDPAAATAEARSFLDIPGQLKAQTGKTAETRAFEELTKDLTPEQKKQAALVKLRLIPGAVGSAAQTISADEQLTQDVAISQAAIEAAKETGKLGSQLKLKPRIQKAVAVATGEANLISDNKKLENSNKKALDVYNVGIKSLADSLSKTTTGPFVGRMLALTGSAQSAEGAVAIMAPLLKKVFRGAGEGTFSDADQKLLIDMIPTRKDRPSAIKFKLNAIDAIIQAKLGTEQAVAGDKETPQQTTIGRFQIEVQP